jgi:hypothetical protein
MVQGLMQWFPGGGANCSNIAADCGRVAAVVPCLPPIAVLKLQGAVAVGKNVTACCGIHPPSLRQQQWFLMRIRKGRAETPLPSIPFPFPVPVPFQVSLSGSYSPSTSKSSPSRGNGPRYVCCAKPMVDWLLRHGQFLDEPAKAGCRRCMI